MEDNKDKINQDEYELKDFAKLLKGLFSQGDIAALINKQMSNNRVEVILRYVLASLALGLGAYLSVVDKLTPTMGVILGSVLGYMFSKRDS